MSNIGPFDTYLAKVGYHEFNEKNAEPPSSIFYAYRQGEVVYAGNHRDLAYAASSVVERTKNPAHTAYFDTLSKLEREAFIKWHADLRAEYSDLSDKVFSLVYSRAYDRGHSYGHDEVAAHMISEHDYASQLISLIRSE